jgi:hypothetical protein
VEIIQSEMFGFILLDIFCLSSYNRSANLLLHLWDSYVMGIIQREIFAFILLDIFCPSSYKKKCKSTIVFVRLICGSRIFSSKFWDSCDYDYVIITLQNIHLTASTRVRYKNEYSYLEYEVWGYIMLH